MYISDLIKSAVSAQQVPKIKHAKANGEFKVMSERMPFLITDAGSFLIKIKYFNSIRKDHEQPRYNYIISKLFGILRTLGQRNNIDAEKN